MSESVWSCPNRNCPLHRLETLMPAGERVTCRCGTVSIAGGPPLPPSIVARGMNYARAWITWRRAGSPLRTEQEIAAIRPICKACEYYDAGQEICTHQKCGCNVAQGNFWGDKVAWATEHCPIEKW